MNRKRKSVGEYLALFSAKYDLDSGKFFSALCHADLGMKTDCGNFSVECRGRIEKKRIFLVRIESGIVAQFQVPDVFFLENGDSIDKFVNSPLIRDFQLKKRRKARNLCLIRDVRSGMAHINLKARVLSVAEQKRVMTRYGNYAEVAKALIGDETGAINLLLWNEQIKAVSVGEAVQVGNARASVFRGERQLTVGPNGILARAEGFEFDGGKCQAVTIRPRLGSS